MRRRPLGPALDDAFVAITHQRAIGAVAVVAAELLRIVGDEVDAAARILDPVLAPLNRLAAGEPAAPPFGVFLKDYGVTEW